MTREIFSGRLGVQQRVLPAYRAEFFEALARQTVGGLGVFAGMPLRNEGIAPVDSLQVGKLTHSKNRYFLAPESAWFMCWQSGFIRWLEEWQPQALVVEANPRYLSTGKAIEWMHKNGRHVIGWGLGAPPLSGLLAGLRHKQRLHLLQSLDAVIAYSQLGAEQYQRLGMPAEKVFVASNAAAPAPSTPPPLRPLMFDGPPGILFIGRLQARKRVDLLIKACAALPAPMTPKLTIIGDGPAQEELRLLAQKEFPQAEFVGSVQGAKLEPYFAQADLFVLPGTGGLAIQQAMAHGLPIIAAQGDGTQDDLVRHENGWRIAPDDAQALVNALQQALSDPVNLRQMGAASYRIVAEEINVEKMVDVFIQTAKQVSGR